MSHIEIKHYCGQRSQPCECLHIQAGTPKTTVVFRVFKDGGDVLALFPNEPHDATACMSYQHIGQHGAADYGHCISITRPAEAKEYGPLKRELEAIGYELDIKQRHVRGRK